QSELQHSRVTGAGDLAEIRCSYRQPRVAQVRMVQDIEEFRAELQPVPLRYRERLVDRKVPVKRTRTEHGSISEVARRVRRGSGERRRVEPQVQTRDRYRLGTSKVIGACVTLAG